jgi:hypothetical protein
MYKGKIYKEGAVDEVFSDSASMSSIGLDVPVVAKIAASLKKSGIDLDGKLYTVEGVKNAILKYIGGDNK